MERFFSTEEKRALQLSELEILDTLDEICKKHKLKYFITAGTLLGAVRHGGFIPWDDDIDVVMPRRDFDKLSKIMKNDTPSGYFYQDCRSEKNYPFLFSKIRKNNTEVYEPILKDIDMHKGKYIDIFPLDKCPRTPLFAKMFFKSVEFIKIAMIAKLSPGFKSGYTKKIARFGLQIARHLPFSVLKMLRILTLKFYTFFASGKVLCTVAGTHGYPRETYKKEWFEETEEMLFEGKNYPVPKLWHEILTNMYGDYMTPPSEEEKHGHFEKNEANTEDKGV